MAEELEIEAVITEMGAVDGADWSGPEVLHLKGSRGQEVVSEMVEGDPDPFFVEILVLKEGEGTGKPAPKDYTAQAVEDVPPLSLGAQAYLGHQRPENKSYEYRKPQARVVASRLGWFQESGGKKVKAAFLKAYVSKASPDLRTHIREGMAGPVSLHAEATLRYEGQRPKVAKITKVKSIDFCNPGTGGVAGAGVTRILSEMSSDKESEMAGDRLTKEGLLREYGAEIREMQREAADAREEEVRTELADAHKKELEAVKAEVSEIKASGEKKVAGLQKEVEDLRRGERQRQLEDEVEEMLSDAVEEAKLSDGLSELIKKKVKAELLEQDDDLSKSKALAKERIEAAIEELREVAEIAGGSTQTRVAPTSQSRTSTDNPSSKGARGAIEKAIYASPRLRGETKK